MPSSRGGFTLIEVSLAVLVIGIGMVTLMGLFPSGMRAGEEAAADTRAGLFASVVLEGMRANAAKISNWGEWNDIDIVNAKLCNGLLDPGTIVADGSQQPKLEFPGGSGKYVRYSLAIDRPTTRSCSAYLKVWERTGKDYSEFYTEFLYGGR